MRIRHRHVLATLLLSSTIAVVALAVGAADAAGPSINAGPQAGIVWSHGHTNAAGHARRTSSPNLIYHGGPVMTGTTEVFPIFWGSSWPTYSGDKISGIDSFYGGVGNSNYAKTNTEYTSSDGHVSPDVHANRHVIDGSPAPAQAPQTSAILAEVAKLYPHPTANAYYPVYIDQPRGHAGYCAWHSAGTINGVTVQFAFFFKLDGDPGCDPQSTTNQSEGLQALGNVTGHELSEMMTDPQLNAWYDSQGAENADKCAWTFGGSLITFGSTSWKIQGNWSNNAYNSNTGYTRGCIDGY